MIGEPTLVGRVTIALYHRAAMLTCGIQAKEPLEMSTREKPSFESMSPRERVDLVAGNKSISSFANAKAAPIPRKRAQEIGRILSQALHKLDEENKARAAL